MPSREKKSTRTTANKAREVSRKGTRTAKRSARKSSRTAKKTARKTTKSARKASRRPRKTTRKRKVQSVPTYKKTRNKVHITDRGAAKIKKNGKWIYVTVALTSGLAAIGTSGYLWRKFGRTGPQPIDIEVDDPPSEDDARDQLFIPEMEQRKRQLNTQNTTKKKSV